MNIDEIFDIVDLWFIWLRQGEQLLYAGVLSTLTKILRRILNNAFYRLMAVLFLILVHRWSVCILEVTLEFTWILTVFSRHWFIYPEYTSELTENVCYHNSIFFNVYSGDTLKRVGVRKNIWGG